MGGYLSHSMRLLSITKDQMSRSWYHQFHACTQGDIQIHTGHAVRTSGVVETSDNTEAAVGAPEQGVGRVALKGNKLSDTTVFLELVEADVNAAWRIAMDDGKLFRLVTAGQG